MKNIIKTTGLFLSVLILISGALVLTGCEDTITATIIEEVRLAELPDYTLTILDPADGSVTPSGIMTVKGGELLALSASVPGGYTFVNWQQISGTGNVTFLDDTSISTSVSLTGGNATIIANIISLAAPSGSISINSAASYTSDISITLTLSATDNSGSGISDMLISNLADMSGSTWESYSTSKSWNLSDLDGTRTVYVKYRDNNMNESIAYTDSIILDRVNPTGSLVINAGASGTDQTSVSLTISGSDATSSVTLMRVSNYSNFSGASWGAFSTSISNWTLLPTDGTKNVYLQVQDSAGNISTTYSDTIKYDTTGPVSGSVSILNGASYWNRPEPNVNSVSLNISASDIGVGVNQMMIANNVGFTDPVGVGWEPYSTIKYGWDLADGYGVKTVYIKFKDDLGNESINYNDTIKVDDYYEGVSVG